MLEGGSVTVKKTSRVTRGNRLLPRRIVSNVSRRRRPAALVAQGLASLECVSDAFLGLALAAEAYEGFAFQI